MQFVSVITKGVMPGILLLFSLLLLVSKKDLLKSFFDGAKSGFESCVGLLPTLLLVMCSVSAVFASGGADILCNVLDPFFSKLGIPDELLASIVLRPFSGSAVTAVADRMFKENGPDSFVSKTASLLMGTTDTIIYTLSIYFSSVKIKRTRYALPVSFIVFLFSIVLCVSVGKILL